MRRKRTGNYTNCKHLFAQLFDNAQRYNDKSKKRTSLRSAAGKTAGKTKTVSDTESGQMCDVIANTDPSLPGIFQCVF